MARLSSQGSIIMISDDIDTVSVTITGLTGHEPLQRRGERAQHLLGIELLVPEIPESVLGGHGNLLWSRTMKAARLVLDHCRATPRLDHFA
jgi:hypothetical protein